MYKIAVFLMLLIPLLFLSGCEDDDIVNYGAIPAVPSGVLSVTHDGYIEIRWNENRDDGLTEGYGVYYYTGDVGGYEEYELMETIGANSSNYEGVYIDHDVDNGFSYKYAVNAYNAYGESELSYEDVHDTPRPEGTATVYDNVTRPREAGFDFSRFRPVDWENPRADVFFDYDPGWDVFYVNAAGEDYELVYLADYGHVNEITDIDSAYYWDDNRGWSDVGWLPLVEGHGYLVWTADYHYAAFRVNSARSETGRIGITWSYQLQEDNPELKPVVPTRPEHAENYGRREQ